jgi:hypothetical protein
MSSKSRNEEKRQERLGEWYAEHKESRDWCDNDAMRRGYDRKKKELEGAQAQQRSFSDALDEARAEIISASTGFTVNGHAVIKIADALAIIDRLKQQ